MKKLILLSAILIFNFKNELQAQEYMKMSKKELRLSYKNKLNLIDSLKLNLKKTNTDFEIRKKRLNSRIDMLESNSKNLSNQLSSLETSHKLKIKNYNELNKKFAASLQKNDSLNSLINKLMKLNKIKINFPSFLEGRKINGYGCSEFDREGDISFWERNNKIQVVGDHWGGFVNNIIYDILEKTITIYFNTYNHEDDSYRDSLFNLRFGDNGELFSFFGETNEHENKVFLCDYPSGAVVNYSFNESDLIQVKE